MSAAPESTDAKLNHVIHEVEQLHLRFDDMDGRVIYLEEASKRRDEKFDEMQANSLSRDAVTMIVREVLDQYRQGEEYTAERRKEIREEMIAAIKEYFSWKRISGFLVGALLVLEFIDQLGKIF